MNAIKQHWEKLALRIDNLSLRERVMLFVAVIVASFVVVNTVWLTPVQRAQHDLHQRFESQATEISALTLGLQKAPKPVDANAAARKEMDEIALRMHNLREEIQNLATQPVRGQALERVLVQFLRRQEGLTLLGVQTLRPDAPVNINLGSLGGAEALYQAALLRTQAAASNAAPNTSPNAPPSTTPPLAPAATAATPSTANPTAPAAAPLSANSTLNRRGLELRVSGPYGALQNYVKTLENALPHLRWGKMHLHSGKDTTVLTLQVFLVEVDS